MKLICIVSFLLISNSLFPQKNRAIFLHHSTGGDLYSRGKVADWIITYNSTKGTSFHMDIRTYPDTPYTWANYPYDYWKLWVNKNCINSNPNIECLSSIASNYDLIIYKHCYPGAAIAVDVGKPDVTSSRQSLENYKLQYRALRTLMDEMPDKKFMVWTLAPLHQLATSVDAANRANEFAKWVKTQWLTEDGKPHTNIFIFDFFSLAAEMNENPANGKQLCLKYDYEDSHTSNNSHPNTLANTTIGPLFAQAVVKVLSSNLITNITINTQIGATSITMDNGTLQLSASVLPDDAIKKLSTGRY